MENEIEVTLRCLYKLKTKAERSGIVYHAHDLIVLIHVKSIWAPSFMLIIDYT